MNIVQFISENMDTILNFSILLSCFFIYKSISKITQVLIKEKDNKNKNKDKLNKLLKKIFWFFFLLILLFFFYFDYIYANYIPFETSNFVCKKTVKFTLVIIFNLITVFLNIKSNGLNSWKTAFSIFSTFITLFIITFYYSEYFSQYIKNIVEKCCLFFIFILSIMHYILIDKYTYLVPVSGSHINIIESNNRDIKLNASFMNNPNTEPSSQSNIEELNPQINQQERPKNFFRRTKERIKNISLDRKDKSIENTKVDRKEIVKSKENVKKKSWYNNLFNIKKSSNSPLQISEEGYILKKSKKDRLIHISPEESRVLREILKSDESRSGSKLKEQSYNNKGKGIPDKLNRKGLNIKDGSIIENKLEKKDQVGESYNQEEDPLFKPLYMRMRSLQQIENMRKSGKEIIYRKPKIEPEQRQTFFEWFDAPWGWELSTLPEDNKSTCSSEDSKSIEEENSINRIIVESSKRPTRSVAKEVSRGPIIDELIAKAHKAWDLRIKEHEEFKEKLRAENRQKGLEKKLLFAQEKDPWTTMDDILEQEKAESGELPSWMHQGKVGLWDVDKLMFGIIDKVYPAIDAAKFEERTSLYTVAYNVKSAKSIDDMYRYWHKDPKHVVDAVRFEADKKELERIKDRLKFLSLTRYNLLRDRHNIMDSHRPWEDIDTFKDWIRDLNKSRKSQTELIIEMYSYFDHMKKYKIDRYHTERYETIREFIRMNKPGRLNLYPNQVGEFDKITLEMLDYFEYISKANYEMSMKELDHRYYEREVYQKELMKRLEKEMRESKDQLLRKKLE